MENNKRKSNKHGFFSLIWCFCLVACNKFLFWCYGKCMNFMTRNYISVNVFYHFQHVSVRVTSFFFQINFNLTRNESCKSNMIKKHFAHFKKKDQRWNCLMRNWVFAVCSERKLKNFNVGLVNWVKSLSCSCGNSIKSCNVYNIKKNSNDPDWVHAPFLWPVYRHWFLLLVIRLIVFEFRSCVTFWFIRSSFEFRCQ